MPVVALRAPLRALAGGNAELTLEGSTVGEVIASLQRAWPRTTGWIVDERGVIRTHVNVFVNGERADASTPVHADDRLNVIASISGGA
ncbi:MAG: MoaD/ThiS family protein [Actinomycetota bacterium]